MKSRRYLYTVVFLGVVVLVLALLVARKQVVHVAPKFFVADRANVLVSTYEKVTRIVTADGSSFEPRGYDRVEEAHLAIGSFVYLESGLTIKVADTVEIGGKKYRGGTGPMDQLLVFIDGDGNIKEGSSAAFE